MSAPLPKPSPRGPKPRRPIARSSRVPSKSARPRARETRTKDAEWRVKVRLRAGDLCERCGGLGYEAHHVRSRRYLDTRHVLACGVYLCVYDHTAGPDSAHRRPRAFRAWFAAKFPERWAALEQLRRN